MQSKEEKKVLSFAWVNGFFDKIKRISVNLFARHFLPKMNTFQQTHLSNEKCYDSSHQIDGKVTSNIPSLYTYVSFIIYLPYDDRLFYDI